MDAGFFSRIKCVGLTLLFPGVLVQRVGHVAAGAFLLPPKLLQLFLRADEFHRAVIQHDTAALGVVVVEREQFGAAVLVPACCCLK